MSEDAAWKAFDSTDANAFADARMAQLKDDPRLHDALEALEVSPNALKWSKVLADPAVAAAVEDCAGSLPRSVVAAVNETMTPKLIPGNLAVAQRLHQISGGKLDDLALSRRVAKKSQLAELAASYMSGLGSAEALRSAIKTVYPEGLPKNFPEGPFIGEGDLLSVIRAAKGS